MPGSLARGGAAPHVRPMFIVDDATAEAIRRAYNEEGELAGVVEFRRHFPLITDAALARDCVRRIVGWRPLPEPMHGDK